MRCGKRLSSSLRTFRSNWRVRIRLCKGRVQRSRTRFLIDKDKLPGRVYSFNPAFGTLATEVLDKVAEDLGLPTEAQEAGDEAADFAVDVGGGDDAPVSYDAVVGALKTGEEFVVDTLIEAAQSAVEISRGQKSEEAALKAVQQAHAKLLAVDIQKAKAETRKPMRKQLDAILQLADALIKKIDAFKGS